MRITPFQQLHDYAAGSREREIEDAEYDAFDIYPEPKPASHPGLIERVRYFLGEFFTRRTF